MAIDLLNGRVRVYNYEQSPCGFPSQRTTRGNFLEGRDDESEFVMERILWDDIDIENTKSDIFRVGRLRFHPDEEDEIYLKLGITDRENIMADRELRTMLKDDSLDNIKKIAKLKSLNLVKRMKKILYKMERGGDIPPHNIISVVFERNEELKSGGKRNVNSIINKLIASDSKKSETNEMQETINAMRKEMEELKKSKVEEVPKQDDSIVEIMAMLKELKKENEELRKAVKEKKSKPKTTGKSNSKNTANKTSASKSKSASKKETE